MSFFLYKFFHDKTNKVLEGEMAVIRKDRSKWPESWKKIYYKNYKLFKNFQLHHISGFVLDVTRKRKISRTDTLKSNYVSEEILSYLLEVGSGMQSYDPNDARYEHRMVPSAGQRYPIELYILLFKDVGTLKNGVYHYGVKNHVLEPIVIKPFTRDIRIHLSDETSTANATGVICFSSIFSRLVDKYGSRGYRYALIEVGQIAQNIILAGTEKGIEIIPIGGVNDEAFEEYIGINSSYESVVYTLYF